MIKVKFRLSKQNWRLVDTESSDMNTNCTVHSFACNIQWVPIAFKWETSIMGVFFSYSFYHDNYQVAIIVG